MTTIDQVSLGSVELPVPPLPMQHAFSRHARQLAAVKVTLEKHLHEMDALLGALEHRAFRGKL